MSDAEFILVVFHNHDPLIIGAWSEFQSTYDYPWGIERRWAHFQGYFIISSKILWHVMAPF